MEYLDWGWHSYDFRDARHLTRTQSLILVRDMRLYLKDVRETVKRSERKVDADEVIESFNRSPLKRLSLMLVDQSYWAVPESTWFDILNWSKVDRIKYRPERQDCDDFRQDPERRSGSEVSN